MENFCHGWFFGVFFVYFVFVPSGFAREDFVSPKYGRSQNPISINTSATASIANTVVEISVSTPILIKFIMTQR